MNYIDILFIVIFVLTVLTGYMKGFAVSLISLLRFAFGVPLAFYTSSKYSYVFYDTYIREKATQFISERLNSVADFDALSASIKDSADSLPFGLENAVDLSFLNNLPSGRSELTAQIMNSIVEPAALALIKIIIFVLTILLFYVITWIIILLVKKTGKAKNAPLRKTNKFLGAVFGFIKSVVVISAIAAAFEFVLDINGLNSDSSFINELDSSRILDFINRYNPIFYITGQL